MTDQRPTDTDLEEPEMIRDETGERSDGRPTFEAGTGDEPAYEPGDAPTVAPEEQGKEPSTEHAPGASL